MSDDLTTNAAVSPADLAAMQRGRTLIAQPGFFGTFTVTAVSVVAAIVFLIAVNIALFADYSASGGVVPLVAAIVIDVIGIGSLAFFTYLPFASGGSGMGQKILVVSVAIISVIFGFVVVGVVNVMLLGALTATAAEAEAGLGARDALIVLLVTDISALVVLVLGVLTAIAESPTASGLQEDGTVKATFGGVLMFTRPLHVVVAAVSLLFLLVAVAAVNVALIGGQGETIIGAAVIDVFALAVVGYSIMTGMRT